MAKIIITSEGKFISEVELDRDRIMIGRKAHNDITLDHRAVSSQHATITMLLDEVILEDLSSTNGTLMKGEKVSRQKLHGGDKITIAIFELEYVASPARPVPTGIIEVLNGFHKGKRLALNKPLTTIGKPGSAVVVITYAGGGYSAAKIDGELGPTIDNRSLEEEPRPLAHGEVLDLAGTRMQFLAK